MEVCCSEDERGAIVSRSSRLLFRSGLGLVLLAAVPAMAFLISVHRWMTDEAMSQFPSSALKDFERRRILAGVADADFVEGGSSFLRSSAYDPRFHFDNEHSYADVIENYRSVTRNMEINLAKNPKDPWEFGKFLHPIEDFYSHSNFIPLYRQYERDNGLMAGSIPIVEEVFLDQQRYAAFITVLRSNLRTGIYPNRLLPDGMYHGYIVGPGMHKDHIARIFYREATETALRAAVWYLHVYVNDPQQLQQWRDLKQGKILIE